MHFRGRRYAKIGGDVLWRIVWLQGTIGKPLKHRGRTPDNEHRQAAEYALGDPPSHEMKRIIKEEALDHVVRQAIGDEVTKAVSVPRLRDELARLSQEDQSRRGRWRMTTARGVRGLETGHART